MDESPRTSRLVVALLVIAGLVILVPVALGPIRAFYSAFFGSGEIYPAQWSVAGVAMKDSTTVDVLVSDTRCSGGTSPEGRVQEPEVVYSATSITITVPVVASAYTGCPMSPSYPMTIELAEPIGNRDLIDGGSMQHFQPRPTAAW